MSTIAYIGLGSNLSNPQSQVIRAIESLKDLPKTKLTAVSPWYRSKAVGPGEQEDYINGAAAIETTLSGHELLDALQTIENNHNRVRTIRWGARTLDLDILLYGQTPIQTDRLTVPHPYLEERNFVVYPLFDIAPTLTLPSGTRLQTVKDKIGQEGLDRTTL